MLFRGIASLRPDRRRVWSTVGELATKPGGLARGPLRPFGIGVLRIELTLGGE